MNYSATFRYLKIAVIFLLINCIAVTASAAPQEKIKVVATLTFLEDFVRNVGGDRVEVRSLLSGLESEHTYTPKPSDIITVKEAQVLVEVGLGLEVWVKSLVRNSSNSRLVTVTTSTGVPLLRGEETDHQGHDSNLGNPHIWLDPERAKSMIRHITEALSKIDPEGRKYYLSNQAAYFKKIDMMRKNIQTWLNPVRNRRIITHHPAWPYFAQRFHLQIVDNIQMQAGTEPSARHIAHLISEVKKGEVKIIVSEPQLNQKIPMAIADETGVRIVTLTPIPGGLPGTDTYIDMMEYNGGRLSEAMK